MLETQLQLPRIDIQRMELKSRIRRAALDANVFVNNNGINYQDGFQGLSPHEMEDLGNAILRTDSVTDAYDLLAQTPGDGILSYYDRLIAIPQHLETYNDLDLTIQNNEPVCIERAIDIASGNGNCALILSQRADHVAAVDNSQGMLHVAEKRLRLLKSKGEYLKKFETRQMNALALDYSDNHFDIAVSTAFTHYLTYNEHEAFYNEVHRILKPGGRYYETQQNGVNDSYYLSSPRGLLARFVAATPLKARDPYKFVKGTKDRNPYIEDFGFECSVALDNHDPFLRQVIRCVKS